MSPRPVFLAALAALAAGCWSSEPAPPPAIVHGPPLPPPRLPTAALAISAVEPAMGDAEGGTYVRVRGSGFLTEAAGHRIDLYFGSRRGEVARIVDDHELLVIAPAGEPAATVDVLLIVDGRGEQKLANAFTYRLPPPP